MSVSIATMGMFNSPSLGGGGGVLHIEDDIKKPSVIVNKIKEDETNDINNLIKIINVKEI